MTERAVNVKALESLGQHLRNQREEMNIGLREIADKTRIPLRYLEAIEAGDYHALPAPVFVKGFLRTFSLEIGLLPEEILQQYRIAIPQQDTPVPVPITARESLERKTRGLTVFLALVIILGLGVLGYRYLPEIGTAKPQAGKSVSPLEADAKKPVTPEKIIPPPDKPAPAAKPAPAPKPAPMPTVMAPKPSAEGHTLKLVFDKECWLRIMIDQKTVEHGLYHPGQSKTWKAEHNFSLLLGNAGGVKIVFDGQEMGSAGPPGQAVELTLPRSQ
ncbi:MAG: RodZ domain-containing protein [Pseudomonadota bacterium]